MALFDCKTHSLRLAQLQGPPRRRLSWLIVAAALIGLAMALHGASHGYVYGFLSRAQWEEAVRSQEKIADTSKSAHGRNFSGMIANLAREGYRLGYAAALADCAADVAKEVQP